MNKFKDYLFVLFAVCLFVALFEVLRQNQFEKGTHDIVCFSISIIVNLLGFSSVKVGIAENNVEDKLLGFGFYSFAIIYPIVVLAISWVLSYLLIGAALSGLLMLLFATILGKTTSKKVQTAKNHSTQNHSF